MKRNAKKIGWEKNVVDLVESATVSAGDEIATVNFAS